MRKYCPQQTHGAGCGVVVERVGVEGAFAEVRLVAELLFAVRPARIPEAGGVLEAALDRVGRMGERVPERQQLTAQAHIVGHTRDGKGAQAVRAKGREELRGHVSPWRVNAHAAQHRGAPATSSSYAMVTRAMAQASGAATPALVWRMAAPADATLCGYLDKKGWLAWSRRWWALRDTALVYYKTPAVRRSPAHTRLTPASHARRAANRPASLRSTAPSRSNQTCPHSA